MLHRGSPSLALSPLLSRPCSLALALVLVLAPALALALVLALATPHHRHTHPCSCPAPALSSNTHRPSLLRSLTRIDPRAGETMLDRSQQLLEKKKKLKE
eukprot:1300375-Rhodomonas_salina.1